MESLVRITRDRVVARLVVASIVGVAVALWVGTTARWGYVLTGWITAAAVYVGWTWIVVSGMDGERTAAYATRQDPTAAVSSPPRSRPDRPQDRHRAVQPYLVAEVMATEPYASARRVFWVVDNGSSHNGVRSIERMQTTWPTATLVHLPVHASWLNQVEIYFSILQRKAISPNDFTDLNELSERIIGFQDRYNATATPFDWTYTRDDLNAFLRRLDLHDTRPHAA